MIRDKRSALNFIVFIAFAAAVAVFISGKALDAVREVESLAAERSVQETQ